MICYQTDGVGTTGTKSYQTLSLQILKLMQKQLENGFDVQAVTSQASKPQLDSPALHPALGNIEGECGVSVTLYHPLHFCRILSTCIKCSIAYSIFWLNGHPSVLCATGGVPVKVARQSLGEG